MKSSSDLNHGALILSKLNDVCMKRVFEFLPLRDLSNAAEVCKRFKAFAEEVFKSVYSGKRTVDVLKLIEGNKNYHKEWFMIRSLTEMFLNSAEQLFRNFGLFIDALWLTGTGENGGMDENELLTLVITYCPSLKELTLDDVGNDYKIADCHNLKYLNVCGVSATLWTNHKFPKLESLIISNGWEFEYTAFEEFLQNHENLRSVTYNDCYIFPIFLEILSRASPQLETFHCNVDRFDIDDYKEVEENVLQLPKLKSLKNFTFTCETSILNLLLAAFEKEDTPIENFEIVNCRLDSELVDGLSKLKTMKTLKLTQCEMTEETLINVNQRLNRLDKVVIDDIKGLDLQVDEISFAENVCLVNTSRKQPDEGSDHILNDDNILIVLHDDCLVDIFKFLPLQDLCNVADVCKSFRRNAQTVFQLQQIRFETRTISEDKTDMHLAEQLFRNFGRFMQELTLDGGRCLKSIADQETLIYLASKYCDYTKLKVLTLDQISIEVDMRWILCYLDLFYLLPRLILCSCSLNENFGRFLSVCRIPTIQVYSQYGSPKWMYHTFWHLQSMALFDTWQMESTMDEFIKLNGHLLQLVIHKSVFSANIFKTVADNMPNLTGFVFAGSSLRFPRKRKNVMHLARLKSLNALILNCNSFSLKSLIDEFLTASTPLSELSIYFGNVDLELLEKLSHIKSPLTDLTLRRVNMKSVSLIDVVKKLPDLKELGIDIRGIVAFDIIKFLPFAEKLSKLSIGPERSDVHIDIVTYKLILEIVKNRQTPNKLCIHINSPKRHVYVPKHLLRENSYWLQIENEINENCIGYMTDSEDDLEDSDSDSPEEADEDTAMSIEELAENSIEEESAEELIDDLDDVDMDIA